MDLKAELVSADRTLTDACTANTPSPFYLNVEQLAGVTLQISEAFLDRKDLRFVRAVLAAAAIMRHSTYDIVTFLLTGANVCLLQFYFERALHRQNQSGSFWKGESSLSVPESLVRVC